MNHDSVSACLPSTIGKPGGGHIFSGIEVTHSAGITLRSPAGAIVRLTSNYAPHLLRAGAANDYPRLRLSKQIQACILAIFSIVENCVNVKLAKCILADLGHPIVIVGSHHEIVAGLKDKLG
jgi:hypothetical protein